MIVAQGKAAKAAALGKTPFWRNPGGACPSLAPGYYLIVLSGLQLGSLRSHLGLKLSIRG